MSSSISSNHLVICPKCRNVLPEVADLPLFQCPVCDTIILAKGRSARGASFASVDSVFNFIHTNEFDDGSETDSLYSYGESVAFGAYPAHPPGAENKFDSEVECGKNGEILKNGGNGCKIGGKAMMNKVHSHATEARISSNTEDGCHETRENLKSRGKEATSQSEQCDEVTGPFAGQATQYLNIPKDESEIGGDPIRHVESGTGDQAIKCLGGNLENNLNLGKVDTETQKTEVTKEVFVESTCQKSIPEENPVDRDLHSRGSSCTTSPTKAGHPPASFGCRPEENNLGKLRQLYSKRTFRPRNPGFPLATGHSLGRGSTREPQGKNPPTEQEPQGKNPPTKQSNMQCGSDVMGCFNSVESKSNHGRHCHECKASDTSEELLQNQQFIFQQICQNISGSPLSNHVPRRGASCPELQKTNLTPEQLKVQNRSDGMGSFDGVESSSSHGRHCHEREASGTSEELSQNEPFGSQHVESFSDVMGSFNSVESSLSHGRHCHGREASGISEELLENESFSSQQICQNVPGSPGGASHQELQETTLTAEQLKMQNKSDVMGSFDSLESASSHGRRHCRWLEASSVSDKLLQKTLSKSQQICRNDSPSLKFRDIECSRIELLRKVDDLRIQLIGSLSRSPHISDVDRKTEMMRGKQAGLWKKYTHCLNCHALPSQGIFCNKGLCKSCCRMQCHHSNTAGYHPNVTSNRLSSPENLAQDNVVELQCKEQTIKRLCRPISGGANIITCPECLDLLRMPDDFQISRKTTNKLRCGSCSQVLALSFTKKTFRSHIFEGNGGDRLVGDHKEHAPS